MQLFVVHIDHHASHHDRSQLPVQTQTPLESRPSLRLKPHWTRLKARVELRNVLQIEPKNADAYYLLGLIEDEQQNWQSAFAY
jgi:cytochrome c-type biogenesis protein CcmH/NrfG